MASVWLYIAFVMESTLQGITNKYSPLYSFYTHGTCKPMKLELDSAAFQHAP